MKPQILTIFGSQKSSTVSLSSLFSHIDSFLGFHECVKIHSFRIGLFITLLLFETHCRDCVIIFSSYLFSQTVLVVFYKVLDKFCREKRGVVEFLDFLTYVPLFVEIHEHIKEDPLGLSRYK